jgi:hypothetical protein
MGFALVLALCASASAVAAPIPLDAPVMTTLSMRVSSPLASPVNRVRVALARAG